MMKEIHVEGLKKKMDAREDFILLDVRGSEAYDDEHIVGAKSAPEDRLYESVASSAAKDAAIVVYCWNTQCTSSEKAAKKLEEMGFTNVYDFVEGIKGWKDAGYKTVSMATVS